MNTSVVIATFNRAHLLQELLDSLRAQTLPFQAWEVIVVDDGSRQPVAPRLQAHTYPFKLTVLTQANAGVAAARHAGIVRATGDIIVVMDDDMLVPPEFLQSHVKAHTDGFTLVLGHIAEPETDEQKPLFERMHIRTINKFIATYRAKPTAVRGIMVCTGNVSFRREDYLRVGGFDPQLKRSEDRELGVRLEKAGAKLTFAYGAKTLNRSDHTDFDVWMKRNFQYGVYDSRISKKHPDQDIADPWRYMFLVNPVSRMILASAVLAPAPMRHVARLAYRTAEALDKRGLQGPALAGATLCFGIEYFRGVRDEAGSVLAAAKDFATYVRRRRE